MFALVNCIFFINYGFENSFSTQFSKLSISDRFEGFLTATYVSLQSLSTVGYGDCVPTSWFAKLAVSPAFINSFLVTALVFSTFIEASQKNTLDEATCTNRAFLTTRKDLSL